MVSIWTVIGLLVLSACTGMATAVVLVVMGVQGVMVALKERLESVETSLENVDRRLTTEVKARAGLKAVEARSEAKTVLEQASIRLATESAPTPLRRPTVFDLGRR